MGRQLLYVQLNLSPLDCHMTYCLPQAIKQDAVRSLLSRFDAVCKDVEAEQLERNDPSNQTSPPIEKDAGCRDIFASCQLPRRVMFTIATTKLPLLGYCFPDETEEVGGASLIRDACFNAYIISGYLCRR